MNLQIRDTQTDEHQLLSASLNGDLEAFNHLVLRHQDLVYNHAYAILGDFDSAEDVTQETFIKAFEKLNSFRGGMFRSWLMKIATNGAYDVLRRAKRRPSQPLFPEDEFGEEMDSAPWLVDSAASVQEVVEQNEISKTILNLLKELPEVYRIILTMIDMEGLDYAEAANALKVPIGTVKSRLARARLQLGKKLLEVENTPVGQYCLA